MDMNLHPSAASIRRTIVTFIDGTRQIAWPEFLEKYLIYSRGSKAHSTFLRDKASIGALEKFMRPRLLSDITPEVLEGWKNARREKGTGVPTINRELKAIKALLNKGAQWRCAVSYGWSSVHSIKCARGRILFFTAEHLGKILKACVIKNKNLVRHDGGNPYNWEIVAGLGARAGLRRSEIYWLSWDDVDFDRNIISIIPKDGWNPKDYEQRHIPMGEKLRAHLLSMDRTSRWVLNPRPALGVMTACFRAIVRSVGLRGGIHTLRHTFASHLVQAGVPLYDVSKLLGHSSIKTTEIYAHLAPNFLADDIKKLPKIDWGCHEKTNHACRRMRAVARVRHDC